MSRVALIGQNSIGYISTLIDIWNRNDCAVLLDWRIPVCTLLEMMREAMVHECFIGKQQYSQIQENLPEDINFYEFDDTCTQASLVPSNIIQSFRENYSQNEAVVIYSSGTTGKSKGIILSHFSINKNADAIIK